MNDQNFNNQNYYAPNYNQPQQPNQYQDLEPPKQYVPSNTPQPSYDELYREAVAEQSPELIEAAEKKAKIARILALIGFISSFFCGMYVSIGLGIASIIVGNKATSMCYTVDTGRGKATAAIAIGAIGMVLYFVLCFAYGYQIAEMLY